MRFILQALMVLFFTLAVAALVALGDPSDSWAPVRPGSSPHVAK